MRVVVTGGAGYIGSVVTDRLIAEGHDVLVIDNLAKGHLDAVHDSAQFAEIDLIEGDHLSNALGEFGADAVIHMAAASLVGESVTNPSKYYHENVVAGLSLLDAMRDASVSRLVFSSTAAVYGDPVKQPIEETDATTPTNPYGAAKLAFEHALRWYGSAYGLSSISLRYFNAAGATKLRRERHDPETHLIPLVLDVAAGRREEILVFGDDYDTPDGTCVRDYIHVEDLAAAHTLAVHALTNPGEARAYNLGCGGDGYSVRQVIDAAERIAGRPIRSRVVARRVGDPPVLVASSQRITDQLGWAPTRQALDDIVATAWAHEGRIAAAD
ncbi:MAG TPA: UDP-glucose 4-epimerase GalE [Vicinamibacterales bacterium]|nr:UDP-glucose 4-epimerase GalE [Vicinamibacterales bacterium]